MILITIFTVIIAFILLHPHKICLMISPSFSICYTDFLFVCLCFFFLVFDEKLLSSLCTLDTISKQDQCLDMTLLFLHAAYNLQRIFSIFSITAELLSIVLSKSGDSHS